MLETIRNIGASTQTFTALNLHGTSLADLRLCVGRTSLPALSLLQGCTALESLRIEDEDTSNIELEKTHNDTFLEMIAWLSRCEKLRIISFSGIRSAPAIVTPLLLGGHIHLRKLEIDSYLPRESAAFHRALADQKDHLRVLQLLGDTENMCRDDVETLVDSLKQLTGLTTLKLALVQEIFQDDHINAIIQSLENLEDLYITGMEIKDSVLDSVARLSNLKSVAFSGISKFTVEGLLEFASRLGPGNQGIRVMIDMVCSIQLAS
jgi:Leucine-rich repeat (LRR) protein